MTSPLSLFAMLLVPVALWQRWIFTSIPNYNMQHLLFYVALPMFCGAWVRGLWSPRRAWTRMMPLLPWVLLVVAAQAVAAWGSSQRFPVEGMPAWRAVAVSLVKLGMQLPFIVFFMELCHLLMASEASRRNVLRGAVAGFAALGVLCLLQGVYAYGVGFGLVRPEKMVWYAGFLRGVAGVLEARWGDAVYDFYSNGSYALTIFRINGVFEEASALAVMLGVFFVPLGFGLTGLANGMVRKAGYAVVAGSCLLMVVALTSTGLVLALTAVLLLASVLFRRYPRLCTGVLGVVTACVVAGAVATPQLPFRAGQFVERFSFERLERLPRYVLARELLGTARDNPVVGTGRGWSSPHVLDSKGYHAAMDDYELASWAVRGKLPILSALPELLAEYGIPLILAAWVGLCLLWRRLRQLRDQTPDSTALSFASAFCGPWLVMLLVASLGSFDIRNPLIALPFYCMLALARGAANGTAQDNSNGNPATARTGVSAPCSAP